MSDVDVALSFSCSAGWRESGPTVSDKDFYTEQWDHG